MRRARGRLLAVAACSVTSGCGTVISRGGHDVVGMYPLQAVANDVWCISKAFGPSVEMMGIGVSGPAVCILGVVSLPVDLVIDVVLLPVDFVAWIFGASKNERDRATSPDGPGPDAPAELRGWTRGHS
jgi:uncharacterized protein YceK